MIRAAVFDLDGTLLESEKLKGRAYGLAAADLREGVDPDEVVAAFRDLAGEDREEVASALIERFRLEEALRERGGDPGDGRALWEAFHDLRQRFYFAMLRDPDAVAGHRRPFTLDLLETARGACERVALATMSDAPTARLALEALDLVGAFDAVVTRDDVERSKPHPDIYRAVAARLGVLPRACLAVEDSPAGVEAALAAGMACVAVATDFTRDRLHASGLLDPRWIVDDPSRVADVVALRISEANGDAAAGPAPGGVRRGEHASPRPATGAPPRRPAARGGDGDDAGDVRWIILSDLHMGETISLLTPFDTSRGRRGEVDLAGEAPVLEALAAALRELVGRNPSASVPTLVVAGDTLGMAYATWPECLTLFERLAGSLLAPGGGVCHHIVYMPGNHDHHVWELAREWSFARAVEEMAEGEAFPEIVHATGPSVDDGLELPLLAHVAGRGAGSDDAAVSVVYPNLALDAPAEGRRILVHHGHFAEDMYHLVGRARRVLLPDRPPAETVEQIEGENFAWIDFLWSALGRSGTASEDLESLFHLIRNQEALRSVSGTYAKRIARAVDFPYLPFEWMETILARTLLHKTSSVTGAERFNRSEVCSEETMEGFLDYLSGPCRRQLDQALGGDFEELTLVWGHTHKPFDKRLQERVGGARVAVHNLGGWTVDYPFPTPRRGASVLFLDDRLRTASLRLFNDGDGGPELVCAVQAPDGEDPGPFARAVERRTREGGRDDAAPTAAWRRLGRAVTEQARARRRYLVEQRPG